jgi:T-complex protein 1 subunit gamma
VHLLLLLHVLLLSPPLQSAEPLLERHMHPTVLVRGYTRALEDAIKVGVPAV